MLDANSCAFDYLYIQSNVLSYEYKAASPYTNPALRERIKNRIMAGSEGGRPGQWSARKAQLLATRYRAAGGGYKKGSKPTKAQRSLRRWTREKWRTSDNKPALRDGRMRRYLPDKVWGRLTPAQRRATNAKKIRGDRAGRQFVANTEVAARRSRAVRMRSKVLGRPIGGLAEFDADADGFLTGPTGEDIYPAPPVRVVRRVMRGASAPDPLPEPDGGLPDAANRDGRLVAVTFDALKFRSAFVERRKGLLEKYVPDRKSEDIEEYGDALIAAMGLLPHMERYGVRRPRSVTKMLDDALKILFGGGGRGSILVKAIMDLDDRIREMEADLPQMNAERRIATQNRIDHHRKLIDQWKSWINMWNNSRNQPDKRALVEEIVRQHLKDSLLQALVAMEQQMEKHPQVRGTVSFGLAKPTDRFYDTEDWQSDGWNERWVDQTGVMQNQIWLNPLGLLARNAPPTRAGVDGNLGNEHVAVIGAELNPWHLGAHEMTHAINYDEAYRALGIDPASGESIYEQVKRGGLKVGDTLAGMMYALACGIDPNQRWSDIESQYRNPNMRLWAFGAPDINPIPFEQHFGIRLQRFLEEDGMGLINPRAATKHNPRHLLFAAALWQRTGILGGIRWHDDKLEPEPDFYKTQPVDQVTGALALLLAKVFGHGEVTPEAREHGLKQLEVYGWDVNSNHTDMLAVLDDLLAPLLNGQSFEDFMLEGERLMTEVFGYLPNLQAAKGMTQDHARALGTSSLYGGTTTPESIAETASLIAAMDLVEGIDDAVAIMDPRSERIVKIMRDELETILPKRTTGEIPPLALVTNAAAIREWHRKFVRIPRELLGILVARGGTP